MKVAVVTGASSGIGQSAALQMARRGTGVILTYSSNEQGAKDTVFPRSTATFRPSQG